MIKLYISKSANSACWICLPVFTTRRLLVVFYEWLRPIST